MSDDPQPPVRTPGAGEGADPIERLVRLGGVRPAPPPEVRGRVHGEVLRAWQAAALREKRRRFTWRTAGVAAVLLVAAGAALLLRSQGAAPQILAAAERVEGDVRRGDGSAISAGAALRAGNVLATGGDGRVALRLGASISVRLDVATRLTLVAAGVVDLERGSLYIDSEPQAADRRLVIRTALGEVRDVGTRFVVRVGDEGLRVQVRSGRAVVTHEGRDHAVAAGAALVVRSTGAVEEDTAPAPATWDFAMAIAPPFALEGRTLADYLAWLSRETGWSVTWADPSLARRAPGIVLHGSTVGLRPDETPGAVLPACGLRSSLAGATLTVSEAKP